MLRAKEVAMVEDLREQIAQEELELEEEESLTREFLSLKPWQRLILALLLFFDVALCGCMGLVMMGRVLPPF
jgi:hypothetical protein